MAVNASPQQLGDEGFVATIRRLLAENELDAGALELEITESALIFNEDVASEVLRNLKEIGIRIALDDFGTGYSSMSYLKRFPVDTVKIDRSFVSNIEESFEDASITKAIASMGRALGLKVVAEGVETRPQLDCLSRYGCDEIQGYLVSRPLPEDELASFLERGFPL